MILSSGRNIQVARLVDAESSKVSNLPTKMYGKTSKSHKQKGILVLHSGDLPAVTTFNLLEERKPYDGTIKSKKSSVIVETFIT